LPLTKLNKVALVVLAIALSACGSQVGVSDRPTTKKNQALDEAGAASKNGTRSRGNQTEKPQSGDITLGGETPPGDSRQDPRTAVQPTDTLALNPEVAGPHPVKSYTDGLSDGAYSSAVVFYPSDVKNPRAATTLSGGYTNTKEQMVWLAEHLASHGFVVQVFTPTNPNSTDPRIWETGHLGSVRKLKSESVRSGSPIQGLVDPGRLAVMGFSMGGAGTILAVNSAQEPLRAAIALCPYQPQALSVKVPTMFVTGTGDFVATPANVEKAFNATGPDSPRALLNLDGMRHQNVTSPGAFRRQLSRYLTTWYQIFLDGHTSHKKYLTGAEADADKARGGIATLNFLDRQ